MDTSCIDWMLLTCFQKCNCSSFFHPNKIYIQFFLESVDSWIYFYWSGLYLDDVFLKLGDWFIHAIRMIWICLKWINWNHVACLNVALVCHVCMCFTPLISLKNSKMNKKEYSNSSSVLNCVGSLYKIALFPKTSTDQS